MIFINENRKTYQPTATGKSWSQAKKNITIRDHYISRKQYDQTVKNIDAMDGFMGGSTRGEKGYEFIGYVVNRITSMSPARDIKHVDTYQFISVNIHGINSNMGNRERDIMINLEWLKQEYHNSNSYVVFYAGDKSFMVEANSGKVVG